MGSTALTTPPGTAAQDCLSDEALVHLANYKYSSVDNSLLTHYVLRHYWNWFVKLLPLWLAPNMVTLIGFLFILANVGLVAIYMPDLTGPAPSWLYYSFAFALFAYQTLDNVDGKQARRTGQSSGLGELFDHGIDSLNCTLASLLETAAMGLGASRLGIFTALIPILPMFFSTWETYHTHTLYLGYFNGPTEGLLIAVLVMLLSGLYGPSIWHSPLPFPIPFLPSSTTTTILDLWPTLLLSSLFLAHLPECTYNVYRARKRAHLPFPPTLLQWLPLLLFTAPTYLWLTSPHSTLLSPPHSPRAGRNLTLLCLTLSPIFGRLTTKTILAHLTRQPYPYFTTLLLPLFGGAVLANTPYFGFPTVGEGVELWYLRGCFVVAWGVYLRWAVVVTGRICGYLDINCLTITERLLERGTETGKKAVGAREGKKA